MKKIKKSKITKRQLEQLAKYIQKRHKPTKKPVKGR